MLKKLLGLVIFGLGFMGGVVLLSESTPDTSIWYVILIKILAIPYIILMAILYKYLEYKGYIKNLD